MKGLIHVPPHEGMVAYAFIRFRTNCRTRSRYIGIPYGSNAITTAWMRVRLQNEGYERPHLLSVTITDPNGNPITE